MWLLHIMLYTWRSEDKSSLSFYLMGSQKSNSFLRLGGKCINVLSHLASPSKQIFFYAIGINISY